MNKKFFMKSDKMNRCFFFILFFFLTGIVNTKKILQHLMIHT